MPKPTHERPSKKGSRLPGQTESTEDPSPDIVALSLNGTKAKPTSYGHPLGPHILAPADSTQTETTSHMEADVRGLGNARDTSSAEDSHSAHTSFDVEALPCPITHEVRFCMCLKHTQLLEGKERERTEARKHSLAVLLSGYRFSLFVCYKRSKAFAQVKAFGKGSSTK